MPDTRTSLRLAAGYWEPRRIVYNAVLTGVGVFWVLRTWPHFRPALQWASLAPLAVLALLANACYSVAYLLDVPAQQTDWRKGWLRRRWIVLLAGTLFAMLLETYWILDEIYPSVPFSG